MTLQEEWDVFAAIDPPDFPEVAGGVDVAMLVDDTVDVVRIFLATGSLDAEQRGTLRACESELHAVIRRFSGHQSVYLGRLAELASGVLGVVDRNRPSWLG